MKILFVTYCRAMLGANLTLLQLMEDLRERYNVKPYVLMWDIEDGKLTDELKKRNIPYMISPMKPWVVQADVKYKYLRGIKYYFFNRRYIKQICNRIKGKGFDYIYSNNSTIQIGSDIARKLGLAHIWHIREFGKKDYNIDYCVPKCFVKKKFDSAAAVITISKSLEKYFKENISQSANTVCIYNGIFSSKPMRTTWNEREMIRFCFVGVLQEGKNQLELLKAVHLLNQRGISDFHVTLVGAGEDYEKILREYCGETGINEYVTFAGFCDNAEKMLDSFDVGVICSKSEAFGRVTIEYMLSSMPVIGADESGTSELIIDGKNGFLYQSGKEDQLADRMLQFINDRDLIKEMGKRAFDHARKNFSSEENTDRIYRLLTELNKEG